MGRAVIATFVMSLVLACPADLLAGNDGSGAPSASRSGNSVKPRSVTSSTLSSDEIYRLRSVARKWRGSRARKAVERLGRCASQESFQALVDLAIDEYAPTQLRWACIKALAVSSSDQAGLYIIDCHKALRRQFSQSRLVLGVSKAFHGFCRKSEVWCSNPADPVVPQQEFRELVKKILTGKEGRDLSLVALYALKSHPYQQVIEYLAGIARGGGMIEKLAACNSLARMPGGLGLPVLMDLLCKADLPDTSRLVVYDVLTLGYCGVPGASGVLLHVAALEKDPHLALFLVRSLGLVAGREAIPVLDKVAAVHPELSVTRDWAVGAISEREPSQLKWFIGFASVILVVGLTILAINYLRMPPPVIEKLYLQDTAFCDVELELHPCEIPQVLQGVLRVDPSRFVRFIRISLLYEGEGEIAFRERSMCIADDGPYYFVGGGTIIDDWYWNSGRPGRVLANWFFDLSAWDTVSTVPIMTGVLYRGDDERLVVRLKIAGLKPDAQAQGAAFQDLSYNGKAQVSPGG